MANRLYALTKWCVPGIGIKRWLFLLILGVCLMALGLAYLITVLTIQALLIFVIVSSLGMMVTILAVARLIRSLLEPYRNQQQGRVVDVVYAYRKREKGPKVVVIGGGTGLPSVLRGMKAHTSNLTAVVTVADNGGSSGRLRREMGVLPPGDLRNNIAALADDESLMTRLFQYRFDTGDLGGHAFGNLFITALASVTGSIETALIETARVLNIRGRVLPSSLEDVALVATAHLNDMNQAIKIKGEAQITKTGARITKVELSPPDVQAYRESVKAILEADLVVIGPGSLYTSLLPNLLVNGIAEALRNTRAHKVYVCNVATQPGETEDYTVADHISALEAHIGQGLFQAVLANRAYPRHNAGENTHYVLPIPSRHEVAQRYEIRYADLTDPQHPWRHDPQKLTYELLRLHKLHTAHGHVTKPIFTPASKPAIM